MASYATNNILRQLLNIKYPMPGCANGAGCVSCYSSASFRALNRNCNEGKPSIYRLKLELNSIWIDKVADKPRACTPPKARQVYVIHVPRTSLRHDLFAVYVHLHQEPSLKHMLSEVIFPAITVVAVRQG